MKVATEYVVGGWAGYVGSNERRGYETSNGSACCIIVVERVRYLEVMYVAMDAPVV